MNSPRFWAVVPAAGAGSRMSAALPKQYLSLLGAPIIAHTLERLCTHPRISGVVVALSPGDPHWPGIHQPPGCPLWSVDGGVERCHSVLNGLRRLSAQAAADDWVLVHDAARPCVRRADLDLLIDTLHDHPVGGLLGIPVADTLKRTDALGEVLETVPREGLWRAATPQMFRIGALGAALQGALARGQLVTDDASAMELAGQRPLMIEGHPDNIKITRPQDLGLAALYLQQQAQE
jgi:2-C-methyl-D-erythritol 4-phosphate cytidylyltransferase